MITLRSAAGLVSITVRNLDGELEMRLRERVRANGRTMEEVVGNILWKALGETQAPPKELGAATHELSKPLGGVDLEIPPLEPIPQSPALKT